MPGSTRVGHQFMDKINFSCSDFQKIKIIDYKNKEYFLHYRSIINGINEILSKKHLVEKLYLDNDIQDNKVLIFIDIEVNHLIL